MMDEGGRGGTERSDTRESAEANDVDIPEDVLDLCNSDEDIQLSQGQSVEENHTSNVSGETSQPLASRGNGLRESQSFESFTQRDEPSETTGKKVMSDAQLTCTTKECGEVVEMKRT